MLQFCSLLCIWQEMSCNMAVRMYSDRKVGCVNSYSTKPSCAQQSSQRVILSQLTRWSWEAELCTVLMYMLVSCVLSKLGSCHMGKVKLLIIVKDS